MADKVNGWSISSHTNGNGEQEWKAVNKDGVIGIQSTNKGAVYSFAERTDPKRHIR